MEYASISLQVNLGATTDDDLYIPWPYAGVWDLDYVGFAPNTAVAADATDNRAGTVYVNDGVASTTWTQVASHTTDTDGAEVAFVVGTVIEPTVTKARLSRGYQIRLNSAHGGATGKVHDGTYTFGATKVG